MTPKEMKANTRRDRLAARDALTLEERLAKAREMLAHGTAGIAAKSGDVVSGFLPIRSEADIRGLMDVLEGAGARICVPVILDAQTIVFRELRPGAPLTQNGFGTMAPGEDAPVLDPDIMLVPLSAFDAKGHRLGYGGGYYDRAIERLHAKGRTPRLIGIAFDCQQVEDVPVEPHDVHLDAILTESGLRAFAPETV